MFNQPEIVELANKWKGSLIRRFRAHAVTGLFKEICVTYFLGCLFCLSVACIFIEFSFRHGFVDSSLYFVYKILVSSYQLGPKRLNELGSWIT